MSDRKHMKKAREKRISSVEKQVDRHKGLIENEGGRLDTTKDYWKKEIDEKFLKQIEKDKKYLEKTDEDKDKNQDDNENENSNKESN